MSTTEKFVCIHASASRIASRVRCRSSPVNLRDFHSMLWQIISPAAPAVVIAPVVRIPFATYLKPRAFAFSFHSTR